MIKFQRRAAFALLAAAALLAPASAPAQTSQARSSANLELVAQGITGQGGTDLEFFSRELSVYMDKDKNMVPADPPVERHFAMVGNQTSGAKIVDITDPTAPYIVSGVENCTVGQGDIQVTDDGTKAAIAFQTSGNCRRYDNRTLQRGSILVDLTDVYAPVVAGGAAEPSGSHNNTLHPSGDYLYISTSNLAETSGKGRVPIFDVRDPYNPVKVTDFRFDAPNSPHDIRFSDDGERAYFAGISTYSIVNTEDPTKPSIISRIVPPGGTIGHDTLVTPDKAFLFLGDEAGGGSTYPCPGGAIYVYDIRTEAAPILLGAVEAGGGPVTGRDLEGTGGANRTGGCTAHVSDFPSG